MATTPEYTAPALDKGLDILELLAETSGALSQSEIAEATGRSIGQIFRVLSTLERRGYVFRDKQSGLYTLAMKLLELAHRHPPLRGLVSVAQPIMQVLAEQVRQSCNLAVLDGSEVRVVAQVESPADFGFRVRVGATFDLTTTATGSVLSATSPLTADTVVRADTLHPGITDVVAPILGASGAVVAALTVPYVAPTFSEVDVDRVQELASAAAKEISILLSGEAFTGS
ncbi:IclR family transcriptional regulator [Salinibacterium sp. NSLL150]|uniref:IclR family transcriptional regulator n=1 Tax=unclassified Salinibacterium TaxID=2632331 RepID=UPI0018CDC081|nr:MULTISPECIES: IclR family transcriptional regulator [unclassified Salinibacterium]MBH0099745.1 IclR family transcriptional regulator [Salinibacterium sp. NSLL35]MBH0102499.1 IclR family transcriptional regulator [Salinibacterium sp. NSLL150]MBH0105259.1 IclR family transcriptional regulator [Salinibacterium sp. NSLL16]MBH0108019.1 IclR family transcriptional regulator [Salinibacterium sp. NSLL17]